MTNTSRSLRIQTRRNQWRQRGVAAIAMALLSVAVAGAAQVSFMLRRSQETLDQGQGQAQLLAWADRAVRDFALANGRLPCPATQQNGEEECTQGGLESSKGWLPVASLVEARSTASRAPVNAAIRYMVSHGPKGRGSLSDITAKTTAFLPTLEDGNPLAPYVVPFSAVAPDDGGLTIDLCAKLVILNGGWQAYREDGMVNGEVVRLRRWRIADDSPRPAPLAPFLASEMVFGVAVAAQGAPTQSSASNATFGIAQIESPLRARSVNYQDVVKITRPLELYKSWGCAGAMASLDTMAVAHRWSYVNENNRKGGLRFADEIISISELGLAADMVGLGIQLVDETNGIYNETSNFIKLGEAIANPMSWHNIPLHVAGIAVATAGVIATAIDMGFSAAAIAVDAVYIASWKAAREIWQETTVWTGGRTMLEQAHQLGISPTMVPNPVVPGVPPPAISDGIGGSR